MSWDKQFTEKLTNLGIPWDKARLVVGLVVEERMSADHDGYKRGFEDGYNWGKYKQTTERK